ncbi:MAG TPA: shikimate kinase [Gemmataceae bacterium]|jgi:shikimate kinase|nr:shikimate kinase [Gemmataceae bacterium]
MDCQLHPLAIPSARIFLIGYRCTGKTTEARLLAGRLGWNWVDADETLESRFGMTIRTIFEKEGEAAFRDKEALVLTDLCRLPQRVVATGGGVILREDNRKLLLQSGIVVWLNADPETIWNRMQKDPTTYERRPPLSLGGFAEIEEVLSMRAPLYRACAHITVSTARLTPEEVTEAVLLQISQCQDFGSR